MLTTIKRSLYALTNKLRRQSGPMKEKWIADFSKPEKSCFYIKPEISFNAYLEKGSLCLGLKKKNCMAWLETFRRVYVDQVINARFRIDSFGNYCATGIMFRVMERGTYYLALVSSKGYFRFDSVKNGVPTPLIGWTETPGFNEHGVNFLTVIAKGDHIIFTLNGRWIAEAHDSSVPGGHLGFPLVSYDPDGPQPETAATDNRYSCQARLDFLSVDSRAGAVEAEYLKWKDCPEITAESRLRLAESLAVLDRPDAAYDQILRAWKQREKAALSVSATYTEMRSRGELFLAARLAGQIGRFAEAEDYINICLAMGTDVVTRGDSAKGDSAYGSFEMTEAFSEKAKLLSAQKKFAELAAFLPVFIKRVIENSPASSDVPSDGLPALYALLGHAYRNLKDHKAAAGAWDTAFSLNRNNGLYAANAANAYELAGRADAAFQRRLAAGKIFLQQEDFAELGALIPKLSASGEKPPEARRLIAQYESATGAATGDSDRAEPETALGEKPATKPSAKLSAKPATETPAPVTAPVAVTEIPTPVTVVPVKPAAAAKKVPPTKKPAVAKTVTKEKKPATKKPVAAKPATAAKKTPPVKKPVKAKTVTKAKKPAVKTKAKPSAKAAVKAKPATAAKKAPPAKKTANAKTVTKEKKPITKKPGTAKPAATAKAVPAKSGAAKKKTAKAVKTPVKVAVKKTATAKASVKRGKPVDK